MACLEILLSDGSGPIYHPNSPHDLSRLLREVLDDLDRW
jgi:hypothetical protein